MRRVLKQFLPMMRRERLKNIPETPDTIERLDIILQNFPPANESYRGKATSDDDGTALIFVRPEFEEYLRQPGCIFIDSTINVINY